MVRPEAGSVNRSEVFNQHCNSRCEMLTRMLAVFALVMTLSFASPGWSYDVALAESHAKLFAPVQGAGAGKVCNLFHQMPS